jgi:predicted enzyme related to lactoylglutathione lyase
MSAARGHFVWYELMTTDTAAANAFYGKIVGWGSQETRMGGPLYTLFMVGESPVAGMIDMPEEALKTGFPPCWMGYVGVDDVDASFAQAKGLGAAVHVEPRDIPNVGRFAVIADPQGAVIALFRWLNEMTGERPAPGTPGHVGWHELAAVDQAAVFPFYQAMFGWQKADAVDMGEMGVYQLFKEDDPAIGGMFTKPPAVPSPFWLYYFTVGDFDAAVARITENGGKIINGPMEVPGGDWIVQAIDPVGAMFALVGKHG